MEQFLSVRLVRLLFFYKSFLGGCKKSIVYRISQDYIFFCWRDFGAIFEDQITFVRIRTETYITTFTWVH